MLEHFSRVVELVVDKLLVLQVDEWCKVEHCGADERQPPKRDKSNEKVGDQAREKGLYQDVSNSDAQALQRSPTPTVT